MHLQCAELHLRLYTLFAHPNSVGYVEHLLDLYRCCEVHLSIVSPTNSNILTFSSNYVFQITLACGFAVLKLSQSPITSHLDPVTSKKTFNLAVTVIRTISVSNNDLAGRLAEVLVQLKARQNPHQNATGCESVNIKVRGRMSMSVLWDSLLEWRQGFETCKNESIGMFVFFVVLSDWRSLAKYQTCQSAIIGMKIEPLGRIPQFTLHITPSLRKF